MSTSQEEIDARRDLRAALQEAGEQGSREARYWRRKDLLALAERIREATERLHTVGEV